MKPGQLIGDLICKAEAKKERDQDTESELFHSETSDDEDGQEQPDDGQQQGAMEEEYDAVKSYGANSSAEDGETDDSDIERQGDAHPRKLLIEERMQAQQASHSPPRPPPRPIDVIEESIEAEQKSYNQPQPPVNKPRPTDASQLPKPSGAPQVLGQQHVTHHETKTKRRRTEGVDAAIAATPAASQRPESAPASSRSAPPPPSSAPPPPSSTPWRSTPSTPGYQSWHHWSANGCGASGVPHNGSLASSTSAAAMGGTTIYTRQVPCSGLSARTYYHDPSSSCVYVRIKEEQIQYLPPSLNGELRLNCKGSPLPAHRNPPGMAFTGYWWDSQGNPYAYFSRKNAEAGSRRGRPRGGKHQAYFKYKYGAPR